MPATPVSDKTFGREVLTAATPVLVEFSAVHSPSVAVLEELCGALKGKVKIVKIDVDRNPSLREDYAVRGLPALILFKHGKAVARRLGGQVSKAELEEWIDGALILAMATRRTSAARSTTEFKLANGLHVVVIPDHRVPVVTHLVWYKVGAAHEPRDFTGLTRILGHLSFKSLNKIAGGDFAKAISRLGGKVDAWFGRDATLYWQRLPSDGLATVMKLEADRMRTLHVTEDEVATERGVVLEHRHSTIDMQVDARLVEKMRAALNRAHTYNLPSSALANEIAHLSHEDVIRFHKLHYAPNNAILVVAGDVSPEDVKRLAGETYGKIPANPEFQSQSTNDEAPKLGLRLPARRVTLEDDRAEVGRFRRKYAVPGYGTAAPGEAEALHVFLTILAGGTASRLYRKLVNDDRIATSVSGAYPTGVADGGEISLLVLADGSNLAAVEAATDAAIEDIRRHGVTQAELRLAKKSLVAGYILRSGDQLGLARVRARWAALGRSVEDADDWPAAISRISAADVLKVAQDYVVSRHAVTGLLSPRRVGRHRSRVKTPVGHRKAI